jgi:hypothetical protein
MYFFFLFSFSPNSITNNNRKNNINKHILPTNHQSIRRLTTVALPSIRILMRRTTRTTTRKDSTITLTPMLMRNTSIIPTKKNPILRIRAAKLPGITITSIVPTQTVESFLQEEIRLTPPVTAIPARFCLVYKRRTTTRS